MMKTIFIALLLVGISVAYNVPSDYDALVKLVFGDSNSYYNTRSKRSIEQENEACECVPYYQCNYNGTMNDDGEGIIDIRVGLVGTADNPQSARRPCEHYLSVCCLPPELLPGHDIHEGSNEGGNQGGHTPGEGQGGNEGGNPGGHYPGEGQGGNEGGNPGGHYPGEGQGGNEGGNQGGHEGEGGIIGNKHVDRGCGYRNPNGIGFRITGNFNNEANFAEFPWMVAVLRDDVVKGNHVKVYACGGSLIHRRVVLTAAHCVYGKSASELSIRAGEWDTQTLDEPLPHQDRLVSVVTTHPEYKNNILYNDYALLILKKPVELADNVEVVCLPEPNEYFDHSNCFATGWGKSEFGEAGHYQVILKAVELPTVPHNKCQEFLRRTRLGKYFKLHDSFMCAGGIDGVDTCTGDGGSPLVCPLPQDPSRYTQAGIVAWGIGCAMKDVPGVYADVTKGRKWIDEVLATFNIDSTSYSPGSNNNYPPVQPEYPNQQQPSNPGYQPQQPSNPGYQPQQPSNPGYQPQQPSNPGYQPQQPSNPGYQPQQPSNPGYQPHQQQPGYGF